AAAHGSDATTSALDSLTGAMQAASTLPAAAARDLVTASQAAFSTSLDVVAGVGAAVFVVCAVAALRVLRSR
ncbi:MAG: MFS transporter, partial [Terrabacter sp.]